MTTTVTLPRDLMQEAKIAAIRRGISLKALIEEALRAALARKEKSHER